MWSARRPESRSAGTFLEKRASYRQDMNSFDGRGAGVQLLRRIALLTLLQLALFAAGCAGEAIPTGVSPTSVPIQTAISSTAEPATIATSVISGTPPPSSLTPSPTSAVLTTPSGAAGLAELKYRLIAQFGDPFFCDPDSYPVARLVTDAEIEQRFQQIQADISVYQAILARLGLSGQATLSLDQKRAVYDEFKKLNSIELQPSGDAYQFRLRVPADTRSGFAIEGLITSTGSISVTSRQPTVNTCPICLAVDTLIATPKGEVPVQDLREGMPVWTVDLRGMRTAAVVLATVRRDISGPALVFQLTLDDGRELVVSPGHPLPDGRIVADLAPGDFVDGAHLARLDTTSYDRGTTYDILPAGDTGLYWANGILLKSTLAR